ncbi:hypothetical protein EJB05_28873, partial [Eragrostis curvula]
DNDNEFELLVFGCNPRFQDICPPALLRFRTTPNGSVAMRSRSKSRRRSCSVCRRAPLPNAADQVDGARRRRRMDSTAAPHQENRLCSGGAALATTNVGREMVEETAPQSPAMERLAEERGMEWTTMTTERRCSIRYSLPSRFGTAPVRSSSAARAPCVGLGSGLGHQGPAIRKTK